MDVGAWLRDLGLGQYEGAFRDSEIEADILPELTEADLEKIGLPLGPRKRVRRRFRIWTMPTRRRKPRVLNAPYLPRIRLSVVN